MFLVFCLYNGQYVLATRTMFPDVEKAERYCNEISPSRSPVVMDLSMLQTALQTARNDWHERFDGVDYVANHDGEETIVEVKLISDVLDLSSRLSDIDIDVYPLVSSTREMTWLEFRKWFVETAKAYNIPGPEVVLLEISQSVVIDNTYFVDVHGLKLTVSKKQ